MTPEQKAALDVAADERSATFEKPHVVDGAQPYHAGALTPATHVPGNLPSAADLDAVAADERAKDKTTESEEVNG